MVSADSLALSSEWEGVVRAIGSLAFVLLLIVLCALLVRKFSLDKYWGVAQRSVRRIKLMETLYLDPRTRVFIVRVDNQEHSILLSPTGSVVLHSALAKEELPVDHA